MWPVYGTSLRQTKMHSKFGHCLLVFLCIWLAKIHRTCAYPAMSDELDLSQRCKAIKDALIKPTEQTNLTSDYIRKLLDNYTQVQFKKQPNEFHAIWKHRSPHFQYDTNFIPKDTVSQILSDDFEGEAVDSQLKHILRDGVPTKDELEMEFQRIYSFLHTIKEVLHRILEDRLNNDTQILHDLNNDENAHRSINHMFKEQSKYNNLEIEEVSSAMTALNIRKPDRSEMQTVAIQSVEPNLGEWFTTREHLKVLKYMKGVYNTFKNRCHL